VLVVVLWTIVLLSTLAMSASVSFRSFAGVLAIDHDRVLIEGLLTAGLEASADLLLQHGSSSLRPIETRIALSKGIVKAYLSDEYGRIDINKAPKELLASLFESVNIEDAARLAQDVVTWRDRDRRTAPGDAALDRAAAQQQALLKTGGNAQSGGQNAAKKDVDDNRNDAVWVFDNINQLMQVPGMSQATIDRIAPLTTVFGDKTVNPLSASNRVLFALPQISAAQIEQLMEIRRFPPVDPKQVAQILGPTAAFAKSKASTVARVELIAALSDGYSAAATAVIIVLPRDVQPYRVLAWTAYSLSISR
jgi:general secretion pathway protein K